MTDLTFIRLLELLIASLVAIATSSGFWMYLDKKKGRGDLSRKLLIGLAHDRIVTLSLCYIERGWITQEEHENIVKYLCEPYLELGGNGSVRRLMRGLDSLDIKDNKSVHHAKE